jgi:AmmeMemoRadiSam system protein B
MLRLVHTCFVTLFATLAISTRMAGAACAPDCPTHPFPAQYDDPEIFLKAITAAERFPLQATKLSGVTLPHHLLAADLIARALRMIDRRGIGRVVILFPDHFGRTALPFATTRRDFETVFGPVRTDQVTVRRLLESPDLVEESGLFAREHGIGAVLPFISHFLAGIEIVPLAVSVRSRRADWDRLASHLGTLIDHSTLIIQSTDFSHYLPVGQAIGRDQEVLNVLAAGDLDAVASLHQPQHTDSRGAQYIQLKLQREVFNAAPNVLFNVNSQAYAAEPEPRTTSYLVQVYAPFPPTQVGTDLDGSKVYCFAGDTFFGRGIARAFASPQATERVRDDMRSLLNGCRLILNLEGVMVPSVGERIEPTSLAMPTSVALQWLRSLNVAAVSIANNHAMDLGAKTYRQMSRQLRASGISVLSHGAIVDLGQFRIVALTDLDNHSGQRSDVITPAVLQRIAGSRAHAPALAFMHWGHEWVATPDDRERALADGLIKAGITLIVGAHPHVASRELQLLGGIKALSAYSLGNFIFDQRSGRASGSLFELRVFKQGTMFARLVPIPNFFDDARAPALPD